MAPTRAHRAARAGRRAQPTHLRTAPGASSIAPRKRGGPTGNGTSGGGYRRAVGVVKVTPQRSLNTEAFPVAGTEQNLSELNEVISDLRRHLAWHEAEAGNVILAD